MKNFISTLVFLLTPIFAQWSTNPTEPQSIGTGIQPQIATNEDGSVYVAWLTSGSFHIYLQYFDPQGNSQFEDGGLLISDNQNSTWIAINHLNIVVNSENNAIITSVDQRTGTWEVYAWKVSPYGDMLWGEDGVTLSESGGSNISPRLTLLLDNSVVVAWSQNYTTAAVQQIGPDGSILWDEPILLTDDGALMMVPNPKATLDGNFLLQWIKQTGNPPYYTTEFLIQKFDINGEVLWDEPTSITGEITIPMGNWNQQFILDEEDGCFLSWTAMAGATQSAFVNYTSAYGSQPWGGTGVELSEEGSHFRTSPKIALCDESGDMFAVWTESNGSQSERGIYGHRISQGGEPVWGSNGNPIVELNGNYVYLDVAIHPDDEDGIVSYIQQSPDLSCVIKSNRVDEGGNLIWETSLTTSSTEKSDLNVGQSSGGLYLAWSDAGTIHAHSLRHDGSLGPHDHTGGPGDVLLVPSEYETIQAAIDSSSDRDTVLVAPGTYTENINYNGKNIVIGSYYMSYGTDYFIEQSVIDGDSSGTVVTFENGEDSTAVLIGFTIQNGFATEGGGLKISHAKPTISNVVIKNNVASEIGAGLYLDSSTVNIENVTVKDNQIENEGQVGAMGAGIFSFNSIIHFDSENRCNIYNNTINDSSSLGHDIALAIDDDEIEIATMDVILDTFTILNPTDFYATPIDSFTFDILNEMETVALKNELIPTKFALYSPYPNPFNPITTIQFDLGESHFNASLRIFDIHGRLVETLANGTLNTGQHETQWNASGQASGIYFVELVSGEHRQVQKLILLK